MRPFLPEPVYIPAVTDLADEIATTQSTSLGNLLAILLSQIEPQLKEAEEDFKSLRKCLGRIERPDGSVLDGLLEEVKKIEEMLQDRVQENFPKVRLDFRIPPPEIKTVLSGAQIWLNDGVSGPIETKGDGLKRAETFSLFRTYVELRRARDDSLATRSAGGNYIFLFEEPELYLHPTAQRLLFDALVEISKTQHVLVSTHSPLFFDAEATGTFVKLGNQTDPTVADRPFSTAIHVNLSNLDKKS